MPPSVVIPELAYPDVRQAVEWLCRTFGFVERLRIGDHRAQLLYGDEVLGYGSLVVTGRSPAAPPEVPANHAVMVRVRDVDQHYAQARAAGATITSPPTTHPYGERQYSAVDPAGHRWTFSQSVADVAPETWGGRLVE
jgi:uncharacterized glyoxalase superfamily protein PhnB